MQKLIELYEMVSLNSDALHASERAAIIEAGRALGTFERAMESFKRDATGPSIAEASFGIAA
jgi:hypothetical protein